MSNPSEKFPALSIPEKETCLVETRAKAIFNTVKYQSNEDSWVTNSNYNVRLDRDFLKPYINGEIQPGFGFGALSQFVYKTKYSRPKGDQYSGEEFWETVERVVNGAFTVMYRWCMSRRVNFNMAKAQNSAQEMFDLIYRCKILPPGRVLWTLGTKIIEEKGLGAACNNCAFVSTKDLSEDLTPLFFAMDIAMKGVGVGYDLEGGDQLEILDPSRLKTEVYVVPDSREGWVNTLALLLDAYLSKDCELMPNFDYSLIRKEGEMIKTFGGIAPGPHVLEKMVETLKSDVFENNIGKKLSQRGILDIYNIVGDAVVSGNVRRSAQIAFGSYDDKEFLKFKDFEEHPERSAYAHLSNNSVFCERGCNYEEIAKSLVKNGEPGIAWLDNMRDYGRMKANDGITDKRVCGGNPCLEQSLENYELCCLVEVFIDKHETKKDFFKSLKNAFLLAKIVSLIPTQWPQTNTVIGRNHRIGESLSGIAQFLSKRSLETLREWCSEGYDVIKYYDQLYSKDWLMVPESIKVTSVKPSGTISLLAGATPGVHFPYNAPCYLRNVRIRNNHPVLPDIKEAGYVIEPEIKFKSDPKDPAGFVKYDSDTTSVVTFPICLGTGIRGVADVSVWEQCLVAATLQEYWADNQVSFTATFSKDEIPILPRVMEHMEDKLKGISFLPKSQVAYPQAPYIPITLEEYEEHIKNIKPLIIGNNVFALEGGKADAYCDAEGRCENLEGAFGPQKKYK